MKTFKKNCIQSTLAALLALTFSLPALAGPGSDGGGSGYSSTPEDVQAVATKMKYGILFGLISEAQTRQLLNPKYVQDEDIKEVLNAMFGQARGWTSGVGLLYEALQSEYVAKPTCAFGLDTDASTAFRKGAPVCFSTKMLSRYPKGELEVEMATLAMHELAHHYGFDENKARKFQAYMRGFVRDFFAMGNGPSHGMNVKGNQEMRPNGIVDVKGTNGTKTVRCVQNGGEWALNPSEDATVIVPGAWIVVNSAKGPVGISCRDYPVIDCDDYPYVDSANKAELRQVQRAGICKVKKASESGPLSGNQSGNEGSTDAR